MTTRLFVREDHCARGSPGNAKSCPIALALREAYGVEVSVGGTRSSVNGRVFPNTTAMRSFISSFDSGNGEPTTVELPTEMVRELQHAALQQRATGDGS